MSPEDNAGAGKEIQFDTPTHPTCHLAILSELEGAGRTGEGDRSPGGDKRPGIEKFTS